MIFFQKKFLKNNTTYLSFMEKNNIKKQISLYFNFINSFSILLFMMTLIF